jgi:hypothetical protein|tara:strand:+ start:166 stop:423 length:258 start_codon:yes stop_codon:yes gene_type:complete
MTQYSDKVKKHKEKIEAEAWGKQVKYIHASNGIFEIAYNNGEVHYEETKTGRKWTKGVKNKGKSLFDDFSRFVTDVAAGRDPYGK